MDTDLRPDPRSFTVPAPTTPPPPIEPGAPAPAVEPSPEPVPAPAPPPGEPAPRRWRRRLAVVGLLLAAVSVAELAYLYAVWRRTERVDVEGALAGGDNGGVNYLIVGSDSREGVDADDPNAGVILGGGLGSERTDTMMLLRTHGGGATLTAVPRDLFVTIADTGSQGRINAAIQGGPGRLIRTIQTELDVPVHHFVAVDFEGFGDIVDALGGVVIDFPHPAFDTNSGLDVPTAGPNRLDGTQALAYVRSRFYTERIDGTEVRDPTSDFGRVMRQQQFLQAVLADVQSTRNPITFNRLAAGLADAVTVDDQLTIIDVLRLARRLAGTEPLTLALPTVGFTTDGGAQVLGLAEGAEPVLEHYRGGPLPPLPG